MTRRARLSPLQAFARPADRMAPGGRKSAAESPVRDLDRLVGAAGEEEPPPAGILPVSMGTATWGFYPSQWDTTSLAVLSGPILGEDAIGYYSGSPPSYGRVVRFSTLKYNGTVISHGADNVPVPVGPDLIAECEHGNWARIYPTVEFSSTTEAYNFTDGNMKVGVVIDNPATAGTTNGYWVDSGDWGHAPKPVSGPVPEMFSSIIGTVEPVDSYGNVLRNVWITLSMYDHYLPTSGEVRIIPRANVTMNRAWTWSADPASAVYARPPGGVYDEVYDEDVDYPARDTWISFGDRMLGVTGFWYLHFKIAYDATLTQFGVDWVGPTRDGPFSGSFNGVSQSVWRPDDAFLSDPAHPAYAGQPGYYPKVQALNPDYGNNINFISPTEHEFWMFGGDMSNWSTGNYRAAQFYAFWSTGYGTITVTDVYWTQEAPS